MGLGRVLICGRSSKYKRCETRWNSGPSDGTALALAARSTPSSLINLLRSRPFSQLDELEVSLMHAGT